MDAAKSVTAHFKPDVTLTLAKEGVGDVNPGVGTYTFIRDHVASVSASPANGFERRERRTDPRRMSLARIIGTVTCIDVRERPCYARPMPRLARIAVPGAPHHITQRGNNRQDVFFVEDDRPETGNEGGLGFQLDAPPTPLVEGPLTFVTGLDRGRTYQAAASCE